MNQPTNIGDRREKSARADGLRAWAKGMYTTEAAAELLIRALGGRLLSGPWVRPTEYDDGRWWFDVDEVDEAGYLSGGELRLLQLAAAIASDSREISLSAAVPGMDRQNLDLVLAAIAHAGGSHEHANIVVDHEAGTARNLGQQPSLHPWPAEV